MSEPVMMHDTHDGTDTLAHLAVLDDGTRVAVPTREQMGPWLGAPGQGCTLNRIDETTDPPRITGWAVVTLTGAQLPELYDTGRTEHGGGVTLL